MSIAEHSTHLIDERIGEIAKRYGNAFEDFDVINECDLVFVTGTYLLNRFDGEETAEFLKKCKELGKLTFLDVCWDASGRWGELLNKVMPYIDFFMPSIDEAKCIANKENPDDIADVFIANGVTIHLVTFR